MSILQAPTPSNQLSVHQTVPLAAQNLIRVCLEALGGRRAMHQVRPLMDLAAFRTLARHRHASAGFQVPNTVRMQMPTDGAVEATAVVLLGRTWLGCALRLDARPATGWKCTEFQVVGLNPPGGVSWRL